MIGHYERSAFVAAAPSDVFAFIDDHPRLSSHMARPSWMMRGGRGRMRLEPVYDGAMGMMILTVVTIVILSAGASGAQQHQPPAKPDHMEHRFDDPAKSAKSFDDPARDVWQMPDRVIAALGLKPGMSVGDIGAGTGYFSMRLAKAAGVSVYAVDIEPAMIDHLKKRAAAEKLMNVTAVLASATSPNLPVPVDVVLVVDTYHHLPNRSTYFRELRKSLEPGGRVAIIDFRQKAPDGPPEHFRFTPQQIEGEMRDAGYQLEASHDFLPRQHFLIFR